MPQLDGQPLPVIEVNHSKYNIMLCADFIVKRVSLEKGKGKHIMNNKIESLRTERTAFEVYTDVENATFELSALPSVLNLIIENYHLDNEELSLDEMDDFRRGWKTIYNALFMVRNSIADVVDKLHDIKLVNDDPEDPDRNDPDQPAADAESEV